MTLNPTARKFRIRSSGGATPAPEAAPPAEPQASGAGGDAGRTEAGTSSAMPAATQDGSSSGPAPTPDSAAHDGGPEALAQTAPDETCAEGPAPTIEHELAAIRAENLTGRQLRMARRIAQKNGLKTKSDYDAVRLLRHRGIDPFGHGGKLELVLGDVGDRPRQSVPDEETPAPPAAADPPEKALPPPPVTAQPVEAAPPAERSASAAPRPARSTAAEERVAEIMKVQRDIARRRRGKLLLLGKRLAIFVLLPTLLVAFYYFRIATPLYATNTEFVIQKADGASTGLGGFLGGGGFSTQLESITVQAFLESREAMLLLEEEHGFRAHFSGDGIDPLTRIAPDATMEEVYATYRRHLQIGYDPTEGLIRMEVTAADPQVSRAFSEALIRYAGERVDRMSQQLREDLMAGARDSFEEAEARVLEAQARVLDLQERRGLLSPGAELSTVFGQIATLELQLQEERLRLDELLSAPSPNEARVALAERNVSGLETLIDELRAGLTEAGGDAMSLARIQSELIIAQADLETRQMMLAQALQQMEAARTEANRQSLYLQLGVAPVATDAPAYPRAFENTALAFPIFIGIYLLISMTVSILREQVSS